MGRKWTYLEDKLLCDNYQGKRQDDLLPLFPGRTKAAIINRAAYLGIRRDTGRLKKVATERKCSRCTLLLPLDQKHFQKTLKGFRYYCHSCGRKIRRAYKKSNPDKIKKRS